MNEAFISIGSNIGERHIYLQSAIQALDELDTVSVEKVSSIYETEPVGYTEQADFLNVVVFIKTELSAHELLTICQQIEQGLGRERTIRWGPRTLDLDILLYNQDNIETENLIVPHPRMDERAFVLIPLLEIVPDVVHPVSGKRFSEEGAAYDDGVQIWQGIDGAK
ncbi:2-amino-4-hydroxy-6-hydroxymethyldihydropteridine diphosphokinase [Sporosarcina ureilytica]|uniref:2-amino-4-hydroxy-6- hydroxymethyldihydropteridine diphosphokinase n=1 Tax=Sporosarcina ureilytica TaxID=298596 RepID=UPI00094C417E